MYRILLVAALAPSMSMGQFVGGAPPGDPSVATQLPISGRTGQLGSVVAV
jgi:hypothetical protein